VEENLVLTTVDNPYNPKTDYDKWEQWDEEHGYYTPQYLARVVFMDNPDVELDDEVKLNELRQLAILSILQHDVTNTYKLV